MNLPSGKLMALLAVFAAVGVITGTGAFTTVSADRTATVNVAGDSSALLQLEPGDDTGEYVSENSGTIEIDLSDPQGASSGGGVNINAVTEFDNMIKVTNQGSDTVELTIARSGDNAGYVSFYNSTSYDSSYNITDGSGNAVVLDPGEGTQISMRIDTDESVGDGDELINEVTFIANATDASS